jgi:ribosomal protein S15P/S13E
MIAEEILLNEVQVALLQPRIRNKYYKTETISRAEALMALPFSFINKLTKHLNTYQSFT